MSGLFGNARTTLLGGASGSSTSIEDLLENTPGFSYFSDFFSRWLKLDITTIAALMTIFGMISGALPMMQTAAVKIYWWITRFFTASISIGANDRLNREVLNWLGAQVLPRQATRILTARSEVLDSDAWHYRRMPRERDDCTHEKRVPIQYLPTFGTTWFCFGARIFIVRRIPTSMTTSQLMGDVPDEYAAAPEGDEPLVIMCLGRSVDPIKKFLEHCRDFADKQRDAYVTVRSSKNKYGEGTWDSTILRPLRPLETVHFDEAVKTDLIDDLTRYLSPATRRFYNARGIPYRRGLLLHGPPGTGKTSLSLSLAGHFGLELYMLHIPSLDGDIQLEGLFATLPPKCFVLLEDIDAVGIKRRSGASDDDDDDDDEDDQMSHYRRRCSLSGLLNVLDGVASQEGRIVILSSNFSNKLDPALLRPGRVDKKVFLGFISSRSAELMFRRMYMADPTNKDAPLPLPPSKGGAGGSGLAAVTDGDELDKMALRFSSEIPDDVFTPAQLQGYLLDHCNDARSAVNDIAAWVVEEKARMDERAKEQAAAKLRRIKKKKEKAAEKKLQLEVEMANKLSTVLKGSDDAEKKKKKTDEEEEKAGAKPDETAADAAALQSPKSEASEVGDGGRTPEQYEKIEHPVKEESDEEKASG